MGAVQLSTRPNIYAYHDYREFLKDWFGFLKETQSISLRAISVASGLAVGFLPMVLAKQRPLSRKALFALEPSLGLEAVEFHHLNVLCELCDAGDQKSIIKAFNKLKKSKHYKSQNSQELKVHKLLSAWYYTAIRELAYREDFKLEPRWIRQQLIKKVPLKEIREACEFLVEMGYLAVLANGSVQIPEPDIECHEGIYRLSLSEYHRQVLELATESIYNTPRERRSLVTHTMAIESSQVPELKKILAEALQKVTELSDRRSFSEDVYQVSLLTYPLTTAKKGSSDE